MAPLNHYIAFLTMSLSSMTSSLPTAPVSRLSTIYQYPLGTWVENIAVRHNGNLLLTLVQPHAELHELNPLAPPHTTDPATTLVHNFTTHTQCTGLSELAPDTFAVLADNTLYRVDLRNTTTPTVMPITTLSSAGVLNGMALLPNTTHLLVADSQLGLIWRIDATTGAHAIALNHAPTMSPTDDLGPLLGINGLRYLDGYVYYNNSPRRLFCRVPFDALAGTPTGEPEILAEGVEADDFAVRRERGGAVGYLAGLDSNVVTRVAVGGEVAVIAGGLNSSDVAGASSAAFGRSGGVLYVTTGGGSAAPVNGTFVEGGKVVAVRL